MKKLLCVFACLLIVVQLTGCVIQFNPEQTEPAAQEGIPAFSGEPYVVVNNNVPYFSEDDLDTDAYEFYSELDRYNRCGYAMACIGIETMPTEERGSIGQVKPSGWQTVKYDFVDGKYLYNRCHLIGFQLTGENANERNLITGTRYLNVEGMLPFENMIADYVKETENHVLYRVTPMFDGTNALAGGVLMEAKSIEDDGAGILFCVYAYNNQPGVLIDYATGDSELDETAFQNGENGAYILNTNSRKFHKADCKQAATISAANKQEYTGYRQLLILQGFQPSGCCKP